MKFVEIFAGCINALAYVMEKHFCFLADNNLKENLPLVEFERVD